MPKATSVAISSSLTAESPFPSLVDGGCCNPRSMKDASLPGNSLATSNSISNYRTNINKIPPMGQHECIAADKQQEETNALPIANMAAKGSVSPDRQQPHSTGGTVPAGGGTRTGGSTIVLISTKISNPSAAKMGTTVGATIKTTGTLYNIPSSSSPTATVAASADHGDNRKLAMICQEEMASITRDEVNGQSEMQSTSKTATILVSKHKTKTGLPLLLKKSKK